MEQAHSATLSGSSKTQAVRTYGANVWRYVLYVGLSEKSGAPVDESKVLTFVDLWSDGYSAVRQTGRYGGTSEPSLRIEILELAGARPGFYQSLALALAAEFNQSEVWLVSEQVRLSRLVPDLDGKGAQ